MANMRVFEIANERGLDTKTVLAALSGLGETTASPTTRLTESVERELRAALAGVKSGDLTRATAVSAGAHPAAAPRRAPTVPRPRATSTPNRPPKAFRSAPKVTAQEIIPTLYAILREHEGAAPDSPVVVFHDCDAAEPYGVRLLSGEPWDHAAPADTRRLLAAMRELGKWHHDHDKTPPNVFIAIDLRTGRAWHTRSFSAAQRALHNENHLNAETLAWVKRPGEGLPPRLSPRAQMFDPWAAFRLSTALGQDNDRPEETFLLHEELLRLAVDSLDGAEQLDPPPVHVNAVWVFARPVIMQRPDQSDRHVRAVWFRQGRAAWRMRTYAVGKQMVIKEVGEQLSGRNPFVPVWDESRPEQQLLAAVWALMSQGGVTETDRQARPQQMDTEPHGNPPDDLVVVRLKAGSDHARAYRSDETDPATDRPAWSVRGHWRRQPYRSLGFDEDGNIQTKLIWITSYTKGNDLTQLPTAKVIAVQPAQHHVSPTSEQRGA